MNAIDEAPLGYYARIEMGQSPPSEVVGDWDGQGLPFLQGNAEFGSLNPSPEKRCDGAPKRAPAKSILLSVRAPVGAMNLADQRYGIGRGLCAILPDEGRLDRRFAWWAIHACRYRLDAVATGSTYAAVSAADVAALRIPVPSLELQRRVADMLDTETARIDILNAKNESVAELVEKRAWSEVELRTHHGLRDDVELQQHDVWGNQPRHWGETTLGRAAKSMIDGPFGSSLTSAHYSEAGRQVIRLGNIGKAEFKAEDRAFIPEDHFQSLRAHAVSDGDLVIAGLGDEASDAPIGRACVVPQGFGVGIVKADCYRIRLWERHNHRYVAWALSSPSQLAYAWAKSRGATRPRLNLSIAAGLPIPMPPVPEQRAIADYLDGQRNGVDALHVKLSAQADLLRRRRQALITAAVTGQMTAQGD